MISALFEPDVDINIEVSFGYQIQHLTVSNTSSIMGLKDHIFGIVKCDVVPQKLEIRLGDVTLEDQMPLHFYEIMNGSKLNILKPYVNVTIMNNKGTEIWRVNRKDTIQEVKAKLATVQNSSGSRRSFSCLQYGARFNGQISGGYFPDSGISAEASRLYFVAEGQNFGLLDDDETVENYKIKNDDMLFLLSYRWTTNHEVVLTKYFRNIQGVEFEDTCLGIKLKAQDQFVIPVNTLRLFRGKTANVEVGHYYRDKDIDDTAKPFSQQTGTQLIMITMEEMRAEEARVEAEKNAKLEAAAAEVGLTVEAYEEEQERQQERARKERQRSLMQQARKHGPIINFYSRR